ncbi:hypothetical protein GCM10010156_59470 [Planobispora rosea]|uniref:Uncharacterized protein n=1 Tax=Planobispora rosea TaxID=35762 RepID=A0A8J3S919_PLARO|nr:hypothetical protein GCM10010156_59470 [Planobispora rosea]GIH87249.1 hypothetical protein Pro02_56570 [Planobispora rosea]
MDHAMSAVTAIPIALRVVPRIRWIGRTRVWRPWGADRPAKAAEQNANATGGPKIIASTKSTSGMEEMV